jgi:ketosteroid isomerase-like protein/opacity protein-like surface antigen
MKKFFMLTVVMVLMAIVTTAQAEVKAGSFSVTPFIGGYVFEGNENLKESYTVGLRAGYNFTKYFGVEGFFNYIPTEIKNVPDEPWQNVYGYGVEGILHLMPESRIVPFLAIGIGGIHYGYPEEYRRNKIAVDYGAGLKIFITDDIALRADVRHVIPFNERYNDLLVTFGICFSFGGESKQMASARAEEPAAPQETVVATKVEEPVAAAPEPEPAPVVAPAPEPVAAESAPAVQENLAKVSNEQKEEKSVPEEDVQNLINKWLASWQSGDMQTYRSCYMPDFQSKGMDLNAWINYKTNVRQRSKDINIRIDNLKISADEKTSLATAIFTQYYSSSILKDTVKKALSLRKINEGWKIYRETIIPLK